MEILAASLIGGLIWIAILESLISSGSRSKKIEKQLRIQSQLLAKMAQKGGVNDEEINTILNQK